MVFCSAEKNCAAKYETFFPSQAYQKLEGVVTYEILFPEFSELLSISRCCSHRKIPNHIQNEDPMQKLGMSYAADHYAFSLFTFDSIRVSSDMLYKRRQKGRSTAAVESNGRK